MANKQTLSGYVLLSPEGNPIHFGQDEQEVIEHYFREYDLIGCLLSPEKMKAKLKADGYRVYQGHCRIGWRV